VDPDRHRPSPRAIESDSEEDRRPTRPTPRTNHAKDHHTVRLADTLPRRASSVGTTTKQSRPVRIWYIIGSKKFVRQPCHPVAGLLRHPNRQRSSARVVGLNGRAKSLSGDGGRGAAPRKTNKGADMVQRRRRSPEDKHVEEQDGEDEIW
jgi:hypothetical protein